MGRVHGSHLKGPGRPAEAVTNPKTQPKNNHANSEVWSDKQDTGVQPRVADGHMDTHCHPLQVGKSLSQLVTLQDTP